MITLPHSVDEAHCFIGGGGTGKTEQLINRTAQLITQGTPASSICVLCATPDAATIFASRLAQVIGEDVCANVIISTPRDRALTLLSTGEAKAFTGRNPQVLANFEINFLMEDMKVSGLRPKRLREMLKFFYRSWSELADDDPEWLIIDEEISIHTLIKDNLRFVQGMMESEIANFAVNYLRTHADALEKQRFAHVIVDDYQCVSRASQILANMLAASSITIAGNAFACVEVFEPYPYTDGLDEFREIHPIAHITTLEASYLPPTITATANLLLADTCMKGAPVPRQSSEIGKNPADNRKSEAGSESLSLSGSKTGDFKSEGSVLFEGVGFAAEEFENIARLVNKKINDEGVQPADIFIAVPNKVWSSQATACLKRQGIKFDALPIGQVLGGDIRNNERNVPLRIYTALNLVANPQNAVAWRCWCGYGDYLTNSTAINNLRTFADEQGLSFVSALEKVAENFQDTLPEATQTDYLTTEETANFGVLQANNSDDKQAILSETSQFNALDATCASFSGIEKLVAAYLSGKALISKMQGKTGAALLSTLTQDITGDAQATIPAALEELCGPLIEADTAANLCVRAEQQLLHRQFSHDVDAVKVAHAYHTLGLTPTVLVFSGFVNGFIPQRDYFDGAKTTLDKQEKMHAEDAKLLYSAISKTCCELVFSYFTKIDLESAEGLDLKIDRIRLENGNRICTISPSEFIAVIGND